MKNLDRYLAEIKKKIPDIEQRLNAGAEEGKLGQLAREAGCTLPDQLLEVYRRFDGEDMSRVTGFLAGLQFLPLEKVLSDFAFFREVDEEITAMGTDAVREEFLCRLNWVPIAYDCARNWIVVDLTPAEGGTVGQVIALDYDVNHCYLLADSLDGLFEKMTTWLKQKILIIDTKSFEDPFLMERSGHLFNSLEELTAPEKGKEESWISLPGDFWKRYYGQTQVPVSCLEKEKSMLLQDQDIDCALFAHMENLKELILHRCRLVNAGGIAQARRLKKLIFVECEFGKEQLNVLSKATSLKELGLNVMSAAGISELKGMKTLKRLQLRKVTDFELGELAGFTGLWELDIDNVGEHGEAFLGKLKNLKILNLHDNVMDNLDFLACLANLTEFHLVKPAVNEAGLSAVCRLSKLWEFIYPVKDLTVYKGHPALESIGMAAGITHGFEVFEGSKVNKFTVLGKATHEELEEIKKQMERYVKIYTYVSQST